MLFVSSHAIVNDPRAQPVVVPSTPSTGLVSEEELQTLNELTFLSTKAIHSMGNLPFLVNVDTMEENQTGNVPISS